MSMSDVLAEAQSIAVAATQAYVEGRREDWLLGLGKLQGMVLFACRSAPSPNEPYTHALDYTQRSWLESLAYKVKALDRPTETVQSHLDLRTA